MPVSSVAAAVKPKTRQSKRDGGSCAIPVLLGEPGDEVAAQIAQDEAGDAAEEGDEQAFRQDLPEDAAAARAERHAD